MQKKRVTGRHYKASKIIMYVLALLLIPSLLIAQPGSTDFDTNTTTTEDAEGVIKTGNVSLPIPNVTSLIDKADDPQEVGTAISVILILTILSLAPSIIILFTSFIRIAIVFSFTRTALATQQVPPNQVLYGLALILTIFIMSPILVQIYDNAYVPYQNGEMTLEEFGQRSVEPLREFMFKQMANDSGRKSLKMFIKLANLPNPKSPEEVPLHVLVPSFVLNELTLGFMMGVYIFIPFIIIDLVVSSVLLSIGIIFLPPVIVSLPIKITLFVLVDGWNFIVEGLIKSFT